MVYKRFVQAGSIALINTGKYNGKLAVIVDVIDQNRVLCDNLSQGVPRHSINVQHINLTDLKIKIPTGARSGAVKKVYDKEDIDNKWKKTAWAQKIEKKAKRSQMSDFDRFKLKLAKQKKNRIIKAAVKKLKKESK